MSFLVFLKLILRHFMTILSFLCFCGARDSLGVTWDDFIQYSMMLDEHVAVFIFEKQGQGLWYMSFLLFHNIILQHFCNFCVYCVVGWQGIFMGWQGTFMGWHGLTLSNTA